MIASSHIIAGTAIGARCRRVWVAVPVAFLSHFVLDQIPHSCFNELPASAWRWPLSVATVGGVVVEFALAAWAVALVWRLPTRWVAVAAGLAAFAPDPLCHIHPFKDWFALLPGSYWVPWVHRTFHCDVTATCQLLGWVTQAIVIGVCLWILARVRKARSVL